MPLQGWPRAATLDISMHKRGCALEKLPKKGLLQGCVFNATARLEMCKATLDKSTHKDGCTLEKLPRKGLLQGCNSREINA